MKDWVLRFVKGALIGTGFILPGVSGGALAAVFGIYERIISFIAHITRGFTANLLFFLPIGLGALAGIFLLSFGVSFFLEHYEVQVLWFFVGCIAGTQPALWREAGKRGRSKRHIAMLAGSCAAAVVFLYAGEQAFKGQIPLHFGTWMLGGALIALGVLVPGLSPSNFLVYFGMYTPLVEAFKTLDARALVPLMLGGAICLFSLSKAIDALLARAYAGLFHVILGIVGASTLMIIPRGFNYASWASLICAAACAAGVILAYWMSKLDERYKSNP
jgi:putative membrane protein